MEKRHTALRIIATIYKILGVIFGIGAVLGAVFVVIGGVSVQQAFGLSTGSSTMATVAGLFVAFLWLIGGVVGALGIYAVGDLLYLLINVEENTRYSAIMLRDRLGVQPVAPLPTPQQPMMPPPPQE